MAVFLYFRSKGDYQWTLLEDPGKQELRNLKMKIREQYRELAKDKEQE